MVWIQRSLRRIFNDWEKEIARPILTTVAGTFILFAFSLLLKPVRDFLFDSRVPYPLYCTAESYATSEDSARTEVLIVNMTSREVSRSDLEQALEGATSAFGFASPDLELVYDRDIGSVARAAADAEFNNNKGEVRVRQEGTGVRISPYLLAPRAILRVNIDVTGLPNVLSRDAHRLVPFKMAPYEEACYTR